MGDELSALQAKHKELSAAHDALRARQAEGEAERGQLQATNDEMRQHIRATAEHDGESTAAWQRLFWVVLGCVAHADGAVCVAAASQREHAALSSKNGATPPAESRAEQSGTVRL